MVENIPLFDNGNEDEEERNVDVADHDQWLEGGHIWKGLDHCLRML